MRLLRSSRWILLAFVLSLVPASSFAGVFISVGFAPPVLPVYEQPPCPEPGWLWTPGYWAYGDDGYYWVPGSWVPAPYEGALWTPPYWGWSDGLYVFHTGYWGRHVGYYGGVNYGFGYMGIGFVGGEWHGREFSYNRAVMHVDERRIHNTYINETIVHNTTIINNNHVSYSGGRDGIHHDPRPEERMAMRDQHMAPTSFQQQHIQAARSDPNFYVKNNHGHPQNVAVARPMTPDRRINNGGTPTGLNRDASQQGNAGRNTPNYQPRNTNQGRPTPDSRNAPYTQNAPTNRPQYDSRPTSGARPQMDSRPAPDRSYQQPNAQPQRNYPQPRPESQTRPAPDRTYQQPNAQPQRNYPQSRPEPQSRPAPDRSYQQPRQVPQSRPASEARPAPQPHPTPESRPRPESKEPHNH